MNVAIDRTSLRVGVVTGLVLGATASAGFAYSNLGPSSEAPTSDRAAAVLVGYAVLASIFIAHGFVGRTRRLSVRQCATAGAVAGLVTLGIVTVAVLIIDNVWLSTVARQPDKIYGLAHSRFFHSMRAYVNGQLALGLVVLPPFVATGCALLAALGAYLRGQFPPTAKTLLGHP